MSEQQNFVRLATKEHTFWLTVLRDHAFFIQSSLAPDEHSAIVQAKRFYQEAGHNLERLQALHHSSEGEMREFSQEIVHFVTRLLQFKQMLLDRQLVCQITLHLPPSLLDHMVREGEEYVQVIALLLSGTERTGAALAIHESNLWLSDASGHAALIRSNIDPQENDIFESAHSWKTEFDQLYLQLQEIQTKLRSQIRFVPSLERLIELTTDNIVHFRQYLRHLEETLAECRALGDLKPLFMDHMAREASYFLDQLERSKH